MLRRRPVDDDGQPASILIVDDEFSVRDSLENWFRKDGYEVDDRRERHRGAHRARSSSLRRGAARHQDAGHGRHGAAGAHPPDRPQAGRDHDHRLRLGRTRRSQALKEGAFDYVTKPIDPDELSHLVRRAIEQRRLREENVQLRRTIDEMVGADDDRRRRARRCARCWSWSSTCAKTDATVLILGESGTGKELIARGDPRQQPPALLPDRAGQLRRAAGEPAGERAVRPREGRLHRGPVPAQGQARDGRRRHALPRRGGRDQRQDAGRPAARAGDQGVHPAGRHAAAQGRFPRDLRHQRGPRARRSRRGASARTSSTASTSSPSRCRPCARAVRTSRHLAEHFLRTLRPPDGQADHRHQPRGDGAAGGYDWPGNVRELSNAIERAMVVGRPPLIRAGGPAARERRAACR